MAIKVSVLCLAYNHEQYIAQALESIARQITDFEFELLVHDDASNDSTTDIIRKYEMKFPEIVKPIFQNENQYTKGEDIINNILLPHARGDYIALCEGDDYWLKQEKLQIQVDYMESHPACSLCTHQVRMEDARTGKKVGQCTPSDCERNYSIEEVILGGGGLFGTCSMLYRRANALVYHNWRPRVCPVEDYPMAIYHSVLGETHYFPQEMGVYRVGVKGSWSSRLAAAADKGRASHLDAIDAMLDEINERTQYVYDTAIKRHRLNNRFCDAMFRCDWREIKNSSEFNNMFTKLSISARTKFFVKLFLKRLCGEKLILKDN